MKMEVKSNSETQSELKITFSVSVNITLQSRNPFPSIILRNWRRKKSVRSSGRVFRLYRNSTLLGVEADRSPPSDTKFKVALLLHCTSYVHRYHTQNYCDVQYVHRAVFRNIKYKTVSATGFVPVYRKNVGEVLSLVPQNYSQDL